MVQLTENKRASPQTTISTAQALYHRFYLFYSIRDYSPHVSIDQQHGDWKRKLNDG